MKTLMLVFVSLSLLTLAACGGRNEKLSDLEVQATVEAALHATSTAKASSADTINSAVNATLTAVAPPPTSQTIIITTTPQPTSAIATTPLPPTATPVAVVQLTEEELAALIDRAVAEAVAASETAATTTTTATQDDAVTTAETQTMAYTVAVSEQQVDEALALIDEYYALYSEVSQETLAQLQAIEQDLAVLADNTSAMAASLEEINQTLAQGLELAQETIDQLETAAQNAQSNANEVKGQAQNWYEDAQSTIETRTQQALNLQPNQIAETPQQAADQVRGYVETARGTLNKGKLQQGDIDALAQQGANAKASLLKFGGANGEQMAGRIDGMTRRVAKGELPQARQELGTLEREAQAFEFQRTGNDGGGVRGGGGGLPQPGGNGNPPGGNNPRPSPKRPNP